MTFAIRFRGAGNWVLVAYSDGVLIHMILVYVMQVTVMQVIDVTLVLDSDMATCRTMFVDVILVLITGHSSFLSRQPSYIRTCSRSTQQARSVAQLVRLGA